MKITCESCGAKYTIADDKVRGRKVKIRCKGCGTAIVVDGQQQTEKASAESPSTETESSVALDAAAGAEVEWSVNLSEHEQLTLTAPEIVDAWRSGRITADAYVWRDGMADWSPILETAELAPLLTAPAAAAEPPPAAEPAPAPAPSLDAPVPAVVEPPPSAKVSERPRTSARPAARAVRPSGAAARPSATAARVSGGRVQGAPDLFAGVEKAGSDEEDVSTSAPVLPQAGLGQKVEEKPTGARNENSVLFSLDALKAGFSGAPSTPDDAKRSSPSAPSDDPFGMGTSTAVAGIGGGNSLFSLAENQALLTAPPPPEPPARPVAASIPVLSDGAPASSKKMLVYGAVGLGILAAGLALGLGLSGGKDEPPPGAAAVTDDGEAKSATTKIGEPEKEEPKAEAKPEEPAKTEPTPAANEEEKPKEPEAETPQATADKSDAKTDADRKPAAGGTSPSRSTPTKEPAKEAAKPEPANLQPFSRGAAVSALTSAANQAGSCKKIGGPTGSGKVTVRFAPSGRVTSATVDTPPFAGTSVGGCVASVFRRASVPPFSGNAVTVSKAFTIR